MNYLELVAAARSENATLGVFGAHNYVRATSEGRAAYLAYLAERGISGRDTNTARTAPEGVAMSGSNEYLRAVAAARVANPSLSATDAHKLTMRAHRDLYSSHLRQKGILRD